TGAGGERSRSVGGAQLDDAPARLQARRPRGDVHLDLRPVRPSRRNRGRERRGDVDDEQVAGLERVGQLAKAGVDDSLLGATGDDQADVVAGDAAYLGRLSRFECGGKLKRGSAHAGTSRRSPLSAASFAW